MAWELVLIAQLVAALEIETGSPDALCPDLTQTRQAVADRLGTLEVDQTGWRARYTIGHAPDTSEQDFVRLELWDPEGTLRLQRDLPLGPCPTMAQAIAVILDRYFRSMAQGDPLPSPPEPEAPEASDVEPEASDPPPPPPAPQPLPPSDAPTDGLEFEYGPELEERRYPFHLAAYATLTFNTPGSLLALHYTPGRHLGFGISALVPFGVEQRQHVEGGYVSLHSAPIRVWVSRQYSSNGWWVEAGPELLFAIEHAAPKGMPDERNAVRVVPGVGATAGFGVRLWRRFGVAMRGSLDMAFPHLTHEFVVDDEQTVVEPNRLHGGVGVGAYFRF